MGLAASAATVLCQCGCCCAYLIGDSICGCLLGTATKVCHSLVVIFTYGLSIILAMEAPNRIDDIPYSKIGNSCEPGEYHDDCIGNQILYRSCVGLAITFVVMIFLVGFSDAADKSYWPLKFTLPITISLLFWYTEDDFFNGFAEIARVLSFFWLLFQSLLMFDFSYDLHEVLGAATDDTTETCLCMTNGCRAKGIYLLVAVGCQVAGFVGVSLLFMDETGPTHQFLISLTLIVGVLTTIVCSTEKISIGFLPPSVMFAYCTFILAYAISDQSKLTAIVVIITIFMMIWCAYFGTKILLLFLPEGHSMLDASLSVNSPSDPKLTSMLSGGSGTTTTTSQPTGVTTTPDATPASVMDGTTGSPADRVFFHLLMLLVSCYGVMVLTEWGRTNGQPSDEGDSSVAKESQWLKIISQWFFFLMFFRTIQLKYNEES